MEQYPLGRDSGVTMKTFGAQYQAHIEGEVVTLTTCLKITLQDSTVFGFTSHDADIVFEGITYQALGGYSVSAIESTGSLGVDNLEIKAMLQSPGMTRADLEAGRWDHALVEIFRINWKDPSQGKDTVRYGRLGEIEVDRNQYKAELRGLTQFYSQTIIDITQVACRADLGDSRCTKNLTDYTTTGTVQVSTSRSEFTTNLGGTTVRLTPTTTGAPTAGYFQHGKITWTSGANAGRSMEVKDYVPATQTVKLKLPMVSNIAAGDTFTIVAGCNKSARAVGGCKVKFGNLINFQGEPDIPGTDKMLDVGGR